jgi:hypothetical protein
MSRKISISQLTDALMGDMEEYRKVAADDLKVAVKEAGDTVKNEIKRNAPKKTGAYAKSWTVKKEKETAENVSVVVYSKNRYQIAHLLEHGHAKRGGGRVAAQPHIADAEEKGKEQLLDELERKLK